MSDAPEASSYVAAEWCPCEREGERAAEVGGKRE
jgi:hypothetical protein